MHVCRYRDEGGVSKRSRDSHGIGCPEEEVIHWKGWETDKEMDLLLQKVRVEIRAFGYVGELSNLPSDRAHSEK